MGIVEKYLYKKNYYLGEQFLDFFKVCEDTPLLREYIIPQVTSDGVEFSIDKNTDDNRNTIFLGLNISLDTGYAVLNTDSLDKNILFVDVFKAFQDCFGKDLSLLDFIYMIELYKTGEFKLSSPPSVDNISNCVTYIREKRENKSNGEDKDKVLEEMSLSSVLVGFLKRESLKFSATSKAVQKNSPDDTEAKVKDIHGMSSPKELLDASILFQSILLKMVDYLSSFSSIWYFSEYLKLKQYPDWESYLFPTNDDDEKKSFIYQSFNTTLQNIREVNKVITSGSDSSAYRFVRPSNISGDSNEGIMTYKPTFAFQKEINPPSKEPDKYKTWLSLEKFFIKGDLNKSFNNIDVMLLNIMGYMLSSNMLSKDYNRQYAVEKIEEYRGIIPPNERPLLSFISFLIMSMYIKSSQGYEDAKIVDVDSRNDIISKLLVTSRDSNSQAVIRDLNINLSLINLSNKLSLDLFSTDDNHARLLMTSLKSDVYKKAILTKEQGNTPEDQIAIDFLRTSADNLTFSPRHYYPDNYTYDPNMESEAIERELRQISFMSKGEYISLDDVRSFNTHYLDAFKVLNRFFTELVLPKLK